MKWADFDRFPEKLLQLFSAVVTPTGGGTLGN
jgi:hypothetical protein